MSLNAITYDRVNREFCFNGLIAGVRQVRTIAEMLETSPVTYRWKRNAAGKRVRRKEGRYAEIGQYYLTANYLRQMLAFAEKYGWFTDMTDARVGDHDFNPNQITPGSHWNLARELKAAARACLHTAEIVGNTDRVTAEVLRERAAVMQRKAHRLSTIQGAQPRHS